MIDIFHFTLSLRRLRETKSKLPYIAGRAASARAMRAAAPRGPAAAPRARDPLDQRRLRESKRE